jgi:hypothetical protein
LSLGKSTPKKLEAIQSLTEDTSIKLAAFAGAGISVELLHGSLGELYTGCLGTLPETSPQRSIMRDLLSMIEQHRTLWSSGDIRPEDKPITFMHSEQILLRFISNVENLGLVFSKLRGELKEDSIIIQTILHIYTGIDMCPVCSSTMCAGCDSSLETSPSHIINSFMKSQLGADRVRDTKGIVFISSHKKLTVSRPVEASGAAAGGSGGTMEASGAAVKSPSPANIIAEALRVRGERRATTPLTTVSPNRPFSVFARNPEDSSSMKSTPASAQTHWGRTTSVAAEGLAGTAKTLSYDESSK